MFGILSLRDVEKKKAIDILSQEIEGSNTWLVSVPACDIGSGIRLC